MQFSIIYNVDTPEGVGIRDFAPPEVEQHWDHTEDDDSYEYSYLEGRWTNGHHRKWCAILTREQHCTRQYRWRWTSRTEFSLDSRSIAVSD